jgi:hypothetical protein
MDDQTSFLLSGPDIARAFAQSDGKRGIVVFPRCRHLPEMTEAKRSLPDVFAKTVLEQLDLVTVGCDADAKDPEARVSLGNHPDLDESARALLAQSSFYAGAPAVWSDVAKGRHVERDSIHEFFVEPVVADVPLGETKALAVVEKKVTDNSSFAC